jgi:hypothetical protein
MITPRQNATGSLVGGAILIALGLLFLFGQFVNFRAWEYVWPLFIVGMGVVFFVAMVAGGKGAGGLAIPGSILSAIGLMMVFQNLTGHWESWAYGWTIIIMAVGVGIFIMGVWTNNQLHRQSGLRLAGIGFVLLAVFGSFFELMLFGNDGSPWRQTVLPVLLILAGLFLVLRRSGLLPAAIGGRAPSDQVAPRPTPPTTPPQP